MIVSVLLMELKSSASKWKISITLISLMTAILCNRREGLAVVPLLLHGKVASVRWMISCLRGQQRNRVVREGFEIDVDLLPYFS